MVIRANSLPQESLGRSSQKIEGQKNFYICSVLDNF